MIVVSDAGPLITLFDGKSIEVLREMFEVILIPSEVYEEVFNSGHPRAKPKWIQIARLDDADCLALWSKLRQVVHKGEAAAIPLARQHDVQILIDDQEARAYCDIHHVPCLSLHEALEMYLPPKRFRAVLESVRRESGVIICKPDF